MSTNTSQTSNKRGQRRREELLAVAVDYLLSEGLDDFSLRQIAKRAGTSHRIVIYHFGTTAQLLREALREIRRPFLEQAATTSEDPLAFAQRLVTDDSPATRVLLQGMLKAGIDPDQYGDIGNDYVDAYLPIIERNLPPHLHDELRQDLAVLLLCTFRGGLLDARSTGDPQRAQRAIALLRQILKQKPTTPNPK